MFSWGGRWIGLRKFLIACSVSIDAPFSDPRCLPRPSPAPVLVEQQVEPALLHHAHLADQPVEPALAWSLVASRGNISLDKVQFTRETSRGSR